MVSWTGLYGLLEIEYSNQMETEASLNETWDALRAFILDGPCAAMPLRDLEKDTNTRPVFSGSKKRVGTAGTYAEMSYEELCEHPEFVKSPDRVSRLIRLFKGIASFDMPLEGISKKVGRRSINIFKILNNLRDIQVDPDLPPRFLTVSSTLENLIKAKGVTSLKNVFSISSGLSEAAMKLHELGDLEGAFLSGSPERIGKYLPLNPSGKGISLQAIMARFMQSHAREPNALPALARGLGMKTKQHSHIAPAPLQLIGTFIVECTDYYAAAVEFFPAEAEELSSVIQDRTTFDSSVRFIEDPYQKYLLHYILCRYYGQAFPAHQSEGLFAIGKAVNGLKQMASGLFQK
ncbi:MAG: hypothetical protein ACPGN3_06325 [Opitutales bacterium]